MNLKKFFFFLPVVGVRHFDAMVGGQHLIARGCIEGTSL